MKKKFLKNENEITVRNDNLPRASGRRRILWFLILVAVVLVIFGLSLLMREKESSDSSKLSTFAVRRDDLKVTVTESGSIKARNTIDVKSEVEGQATIVSIVPEGSYITQENVKNGKVNTERN
jgi:multidrug efflux pump subunit AcrA (membrane-fusion protein)